MVDFNNAPIHNQMVVVKRYINYFSSLWCFLNSLSSLQTYVINKIYWFFFPKMKGFKWKYKNKYKYSYIYDLTIAFPSYIPYPILISFSHPLKCIQITTITFIDNIIHRSE